MLRLGENRAGLNLRSWTVFNDMLFDQCPEFDLYTCVPALATHYVLAPSLVTGLQTEAHHLHLATYMFTLELFRARLR